MKCDIDSKTFQYTEHEDNDYEAAIDPNNNLYEKAQVMIVYIIQLISLMKLLL